jgi:NHL repeat-containing protein
VNDFNNSRVLIWNKLPAKSHTPAAVVVGQPDFTSNAQLTTQSSLKLPEAGLAVVGGKLFVADRENHRIMIWNTIPTTNGAPADVVVGQPDFVSSNNGLSQTALNEPEGLWSDGTRLVVADFLNSRVLIWDTIPTINGAPADVVVGQADFNTGDIPSPPTAQSLNRPFAVTSDGTRLFVADTFNNRVLVYSPFPTTNNPAASFVLGQSDFVHGDANAGNLGPSAQTLSNPYGLFVSGTKLYVSDFNNARVLIFGL